MNLAPLVMPRLNQQKAALLLLMSGVAILGQISRPIWQPLLRRAAPRVARLVRKYCTIWHHWSLVARPPFIQFDRAARKVINTSIFSHAFLDISLTTSTCVDRVSLPPPAPPLFIFFLQDRVSNRRCFLSKLVNDLMAFVCFGCVGPHRPP